MIRQRFYGLIIILLCLVFILMAMQGNTSGEKDITPVILLLPLGLYMIFSKKYLLHQFTEDNTMKFRPQLEQPKHAISNKRLIGDEGRAF